MTTRFPRLRILVGGGLLGLLGMGCFTDPINRPPEISAITSLPPIVVRGQPAEFTATASDPDQDPTTLTWAQVPGTCADSADRAHWPLDAAPLAPGTESFMVSDSQTLARFCVWAFATDRFGAVKAATLQEDPANRPPIAAIAIRRPDQAATFPLYSDFWLSGAGSSDPENEGLSYSWTLDHAPSGSTASVGPCPMGEASDACLFADVPGVFVVSLLARDPLGAQSTESVTLTVAEDQAPCISISRPDYLSAHLIHDPTLVDSFVVDRVTDDGDPYPAGPHGEVHFSWSIGHGDAPPVFQDNDFHSLDVAAGTFLLGETGRVRVEIHDRKARTIEDILAGCGDASLCAARPGCFQRVTWSISYQ